MEGSSKTWIIIGVVIFIIIIIVIVIIFFFNVGSTVVVNIRPIQSPCLNDAQCSPGLACSNGICLSPIGSGCSTLNDCVAGATACFQGVCVNNDLSGVGGPPPCVPGLIDENGICVSPELGPCQSDDDCSEGLKCRNGECIKRNRGFNKPCSTTEPCDFGFTCDFDDNYDDKCKNGKNKNRKRNGRCKIANNSVVPCMEDDQCIAGSECHHNKCVIKRKCDESNKSSDYKSSTDSIETSGFDKFSNKSNSYTSESSECRRVNKSTTFDLSSSDLLSSNSRDYMTISKSSVKTSGSNLTSGIKLVRGNDDYESSNIISQKLINRIKTQS